MSDLDDLMDIDPLELTSSPEKLQAYINAHRERRAKREGGATTRAKREDGPKLALGGDFIKNMTSTAPKPGPVVKRRI